MNGVVSARGRAPLFIFSVALTAMFGITACSEPKPGDRVKVDPPYGFNIVDSDTPVITRLYKYRYGNGAGNDYRIEDEPVSFKFPAKFYAWRNNQQGGPQWMVTLLVDRTNMQSLSDFLSRVYKRFGAYEPSAIYQRFSLRDLSVTIISQIIDTHLPLDVTPSHLEIFGLQPVGSYCGFNMYGTIKGNVGILSAAIRYPDAPSASQVIGVSGHGPSQLSITCYSSSPICVVGFLYKGLEVNFKEAKGSICQSSADRQRIIAFLDQHRV